VSGSGTAVFCIAPQLALNITPLGVHNAPLQIFTWVADFAAELYAQQIELRFVVALLDGPEIQGNRGKFVDDRNCLAVLGEVDGLHVVSAGVAGFDSHVGKIRRGVNHKLGDAFLAASRA
jgi:hypothetical protein